MSNEWPDNMELLGDLMDAVGVLDDGRSSPRELWARCIAKVIRQRRLLESRRGR